MDEIIVPVDIMEEEKSILAILSIRQFVWIAPFLILFIVTMLWGDFPFLTGFADFIVRTAVTFLLLGGAALMAFLPLPSHDCYLDRFIMNWIKFKRSTKDYINI